MKGKWENAISGKQLDNVQEETLVASVMSKHPETDAARDQKNKRLLPHQKARAQTDEKLPSKSSGHRGEYQSGTRGRCPCRDFLKGKCTNSSCNYWHPPVCLNYKSETGCAYGKKCRFRHVEIDGQPSKKSKKSGGKGSVALLKESIQLGCVSHDSHPRKSVLWKDGQLGPKHTVKFSMGPWHHLKDRERKGSIARRQSEM